MQIFNVASNGRIMQLELNFGMMWKEVIVINLITCVPEYVHDGKIEKPEATK
jgi:hypothetical protein